MIKQLRELCEKAKNAPLLEDGKVSEKIARYAELGRMVPTLLDRLERAEAVCEAEAKRRQLNDLLLIAHEEPEFSNVLMQLERACDEANVALAAYNKSKEGAE